MAACWLSEEGTVISTNVALMLATLAKLCLRGRYHNQVTLNLVWLSVSPGAGESSRWANCQSQLSINTHTSDIKTTMSSNLINGAIISKMTTSTLIRGLEFSDWDDSLKNITDLVFLERSWGFLNTNQLEPASSDHQWRCILRYFSIGFSFKPLASTDCVFLKSEWSLSVIIYLLLDVSCILSSVSQHFVH